jgi:hypothetical protein
MKTVRQTEHCSDPVETRASPATSH